MPANILASQLALTNFSLYLKEIRSDFKFTEIIDTNPFLLSKDKPVNQSKYKVYEPKSCNKSSVVNTLSYCKFKNNCDPNAECIYNSTSYKYICKCFVGYIGNGYKCYGI